MKKEEKLNRLLFLRAEMENNKKLKISLETQNQVKEDEPIKRVEHSWKIQSFQKKIQMKTQALSKSVLRESQINHSKPIKNWDYNANKLKIIAKFLPSNIYYPPSCSGYDIAYCKSLDSIFIFGGIPCSSSLSDGIKSYFYKYTEGHWSEVKPESVYNPTPRYGHTLTAYQKELILFGGVSEYKEKLKDRCFYTDCSTYNATKSSWKIIETTGQNTKTRKNHTACVYGKYFITFGGLNESEEVINEMGWINLDYKKPRWKHFSIDGRYNHRMVVVEPQNGKDFICIFGGRNGQSEIVDSMYFVPLSISDGELNIREVTTVGHIISPRQLPIMTEFGQGFLIIGGINDNSDIAQDCWQYDNQKGTVEEVKLSIDFSDLRGAKFCSIRGEKIYILTGNSTNCKAIEFMSDK